MTTNDKVSPLEAALDKIHTVANSLRDESWNLSELIDAAHTMGMNPIVKTLCKLQMLMQKQADALKEASGDVVAYTLGVAEASSANVVKAALAGASLAARDLGP